MLGLGQNQLPKGLVLFVDEDTGSFDDLQTCLDENDAHAPPGTLPPPNNTLPGNLPDEFSVCHLSVLQSMSSPFPSPSQSGRLKVAMAQARRRPWRGMRWGGGTRVCQGLDEDNRSPAGLG